MSQTDSTNEETLQERNLAKGLYDLADQSIPPSGVSVDGVISAGRRRVRERRGRAAMGTAAVVAAVTAGVWGSTVFAAGPAHTATRPATASASATASVPGTDPATPPVAFGWLPDLTPGGPTWNTAPNGDFQLADEYGAFEISLRLQHPGEAEPAGPYTDAGTVSGHKAVWAQGGLSYPQLVWQYKPGAWADLLYAGKNPSDANKIGDNLEFGPLAPMTMPLHVPSMPSGFSATGGWSEMRNTTTSPPVGSASFALCPDSGCHSGADTLLISTEAGIPADEHQGTLPGKTSPAAGAGVAQATVDGQPAFVIVDPTVIAAHFTVDGLQVNASVSNAAIKAIGGEAGLVKFLNTITWYGVDQTHWTTDVIG